MTIEHINANNPLTERHAGMMAVLRDKRVCGPLICISFSARGYPWGCGEDHWSEDGASLRWCESSTDIIAVLPMPDLSGVK